MGQVSWMPLRMPAAGLPQRQLNGVRSRIHEDLHGRRQIFNAGEKGSFIEESVVDGDIEAALRFRVEQSV